MSKLLIKDYMQLVDKYFNCVVNWSDRFLNFAGLLQLIKAVPTRIIEYGSMYIFLPKIILKRINSLMLKFVWGGFYKLSVRCHYKVS